MLIVVKCVGVSSQLSPHSREIEHSVVFENKSRQLYAHMMLKSPHEHSYTVGEEYVLDLYSLHEDDEEVQIL